MMLSLPTRVPGDTEQTSRSVSRYQRLLHSSSFPPVYGALVFVSYQRAMPPSIPRSSKRLRNFIIVTSPHNMLPLLWQIRYCFNFNQEFFSGQSSYFNKGACRWVVCVHIAITNLTEDW